MPVTSHLYPKAVQAMAEKTIDLAADTFKAVLFTGDASAWGATQEAYQYLGDLTAAYGEVTDADYARLAVAGLSVTVSGSKVIFTATSPLDWGSAVTISARSLAIVDESVGTADASYPVITVTDFGQVVSSTAGPWTYTIDPVNGLAAFTCS